MIETYVRFAIVIALATTGCGKDDKKKPAAGDQAPAIANKVEARPAAPAKPAEPAPAAPAAMTTLDLDAIGYQIDVPDTWTVTQLNGKGFIFRIPSIKQGSVTVVPSLTIMQLPSGPDSAEKAGEKCYGKLLETKEIDGALFFKCEQEAAGQKILNFGHIIPGKGEYIHCEGSGPDLTATMAACRSLKKK